MGLIYGLLRGSARIWLGAFHGLRVEGAGNVPAAGGALIASNHASFYDPMALCQGLRREVGYIARTTLRDSRLYRSLTARIHIVDIRRGAGDRNALRAVEESLRSGNALVMFPEGTRTRDGRLQPFKAGIALLVRATGVPVVPAWVEGSFAAWPKGRRFPRLFKRIRVRYGVPLRFDPKTDRAEIVRRLEEAVAALAPDPSARDAARASNPIES